MYVNLHVTTAHMSACVTCAHMITLITHDVTAAEQHDRYCVLQLADQPALCEEAAGAHLEDCRHPDPHC